ncbi:MarR family winged helix-turn-helix transcriptional regulator [Paenibacillus rigui]|uniref:MarR family transcriptional regulator n=1 Tax=Paenibacillus rigui TaxID=554312 RepID=A0A229UJD1_9BACL|nr:MarR family transcriptional regulator [Paenibacillus rigui]OXM83568.1 MarR family transcriptional regulator [Paenibacillus rigui]
MEREQLLKLDNQLCFAVYALSREITKIYRPHLEELGLTYTQYVTLLALWEEDDITVKELGARLYLDSGTLTPLLKRLEQMGLIRRVRDVKDERNVLIQLTEQGKALKERAYEIPEKVFCHLGLDPQEISQWRKQLTQLTHTIQQFKSEE